LRNPRQGRNGDRLDYRREIVLLSQSREGLLMAIALTILPLVFLWMLVKLLPPWPEKNMHEGAAAD
jgi:hypothetical protein